MYPSTGVLAPSGVAGVRGGGGGKGSECERVEIRIQTRSNCMYRNETAIIPKRSFQSYPDESDRLDGAWNMHEILTF